jgi:hypothetical protein
MERSRCSPLAHLSCWLSYSLKIVYCREVSPSDSTHYSYTDHLRLDGVVVAHWLTSRLRILKILLIVGRYPHRIAYILVSGELIKRKWSTTSDKLVLLLVIQSRTRSQKFLKLHSHCFNRFQKGAQTFSRSTFLDSCYYQGQGTIMYQHGQHASM